MEPHEPSARQAVSRRWPEAGVALLLLAAGLVLVADSLRVGIGWAEDGPRAGYFPFYIGLMLVVASGWNLVKALHARHAAGGFASRAQLRDVASMLVPMTAFVAGVAFLGLYVSAALLLGYFMRRHGRYRWGTTLAVALGVPVIAFLVFERWFLVPLAKGPLEAWLGF